MRKSFCFAVIALLTLALAFSALAFDPQNELAGLTEAMERTRCGTDAGPWREQDWYPGWLETYGLTGDYEPDTIKDFNEETKLSGIAYDDWAAKCGITNENDFSEASEVWAFTHTENGTRRELALVKRCHGGTGLEDEHDFYTLLDRADGSIIARSDVEEYMKFLRHAEGWKKEQEAKLASYIQLAKETVAARFSKREMPTTMETLADYDAEVIEDDQTYRVYLTPKGEWASEFTVLIPKADEKAKVESWAGHVYPRYTQAELEKVLADYDKITADYENAVAQAGGIGHMTLEQRKALGDSIRERLEADDGELNLWYDTVVIKIGLPVWNDPRVWDAALPTEKDMTENEALPNAWMDIAVFCWDQMPGALQGVRFTAYFLKGNIWMVIGTRNEQGVFRVDLDSRTSKLLYAAQFVNGEWRDLREGITAETLEWVLGPFGEWSILEKYRYGVDYNGVYYYGFPNETEMQPDEALKYAKERLAEAYPGLTMEMLDAAVVCPYFYTAHAEPLYGQTYDKDIYYFSFDLDPASRSGLLVYEIIFDAADGTVRVLHDPQTTGNG